MRYRKGELREYAEAHLRGLWGASLTPFREDYSLDEEGFRRNLRTWREDLGLGGIFVSGKQGEFFSLSLAERKRTFEIAVEEGSEGFLTMTSCWDMNIDNTLDLMRYSEAIGADFVIVLNPFLYFGPHGDDTIFEYYRYLCEKVEIGVALWNNPDQGYAMSPQLCARLAELPNVVAIKDSVSRDEYAELTRLAGDRLRISNPFEDAWLDNIVELGWKIFLASADAYLLQSPVDRRFQEYTDLALAGQVEQARAVRDSLDPVRKAMKSTRPAGKTQAHYKYWQELVGQVGGPVRRPLPQLNDQEKATIRAAFEASGLKTAAAVSSA